MASFKSNVSRWPGPTLFERQRFRTLGFTICATPRPLDLLMPALTPLRLLRFWDIARSRCQRVILTQRTRERGGLLMEFWAGPKIPIPYRSPEKEAAGSGLPLSDSEN